MVEKVVWRKADLAIVWDIDNESRFFKVMDGWFGNVVGAHVTVTDIPDAEADPQWHVVFVHELGHVIQNYIFGVFFFPVYIAHSVVIWAFHKDKHMHLDNFFERWARRRAGQPVEIPREQWYDGKSDRNPWW
jgi:hypothetical protein